MKTNQHHFAEAEGKRDGYTDGLSYGYHHGRCEAILSNTPRVSPIKWELNVLYVGSNNGLPYVPIDHGIVEALGSLVREVRHCVPTDDIVGLVQAWRPHLVLVLDCVHSVTVDRVDAIRSLGVKTAVWFPDDPYYTDVTVHVSLHYDYVFTSELNMVQFYNELGCPQVYYLPFATSTSVFRPSKMEPAYRSEICFLGTAYWNRVALFDSIADYLAERNVVIVGYWWDRLKNYSRLKDKIRLGAWLTPQETLKYYCGAKIVMNLHREPGDPSINQNSFAIPALSVNPRTFDICSSGAFQLTDVRDDLHSLYMAGHEVSTFSSTSDLIYKLDYYLHHEEERRQIALRGLSRTLQHHTFLARLQRLLQAVWT